MSNLLKSAARKLVNQAQGTASSVRRMPINRRRAAALAAVDSIAAIRKRSAAYEGLRDQIRRSGTDSLVHFGNGYTHEGDYFLQQNPDELTSLCLFLQERGPYENYAEIGSASGGTCLFLHKQLGFGHTLSLDDGQHVRAVEQKRHFSQIENFKQFLGDSHSDAARVFLQENLTGKLDIAFVDGDHSYEGVSQDVQLMLPFSKPGTLMIFHDTVACEAVEECWLECVEKKIIQPLAEYIGAERPLGIAVGAVL